jgi:hypothetical protein
MPAVTIASSCCNFVGAAGNSVAFSLRAISLRNRSRAALRGDGSRGLFGASD